MDLPDPPVANPNVVLREEFDDWAVLFDPDTANALGLNPVGVAIWKRLDGTRTLEQIAGEIRGQFTGAPEKVEDDVAAFVRQLVEAGMIGARIA